jgi:hypothetical protein
MAKANANDLLYWKALIAAACTVALIPASVCLCVWLMPWLGQTLYKHSYLEARKQEIVDLVADHAPPDTSITVSEAHITPPPPKSDGWFLEGWLGISFTLAVEAKEDLPDSFDLYEDLSGETPSIQRVWCRTPEKLRNEEAGASVYRLVCFSEARCSALRCLLLIDWDSR